MSALIKKIYEDYSKNFGKAKADLWLQSYQATTQNALKIKGNSPDKAPHRNKGTKSLIRPSELYKNQNKSSINSIAVTNRQEPPPVIPPTITQGISRRPSLTEALDKQAWKAERLKAFERFDKNITQHAEKALKYTSIDELSSYQPRRQKTREIFTYLMRLVFYTTAFDEHKRYKHLDKFQSITLFTGMDLVKHCALNDLGISHTAFWSYLRTLKEAGLVDYRGHKTTVEGRTVNDGTLLKIKLKASPKAVTLNHFDFEDVQYRDLEADIKQQHTLHNAVLKCEQSLILQDSTRGSLLLCVSWMLTPSKVFFNQLEELALSDCTSFTELFESKHPQAILDVMNAHRSKRNTTVESAAKSLAELLDDWGSLSFYRKLLWQLLRCRDRGIDLFEAVYQLLEKVLIDMREDYQGKAGVLFVIRLKKQDYYDALWRDQNQWVSNPPDAPTQHQSKSNTNKPLL